MKNVAFENDKCKIINDDCFSALKNIKSRSVDMIFADPPYFLSSGGISCQSGRQVINHKGEWDKTCSFEEKLSFNRKWIRLCKRILKDDGTIWISGTLHNIYAVGAALEMEGFSIINNITWIKPNPAPNLACRCFTNSTETILWARKINNGKKGKHYFNYDLMKEINGGKQMKDAWILNLPKKAEKTHGKHPTQKPESVLERIILSSTKEGDLILDPFSGSGTTGVVALKLNRKYLGIEIDINFVDLSIKRLSE